MIIFAKNWAEFQHYKGRNPPWIKLHKRLLDDYEFQRLPLASKALAPMLWLLCSESADGQVDANTVKLSFRLRMKPAEIEAGLKPLIQSGFFHIASTPLAERLHDAIPETERETEAETDFSSKSPSGAFDEFWLSCPRKVGKGAARKAYAKAITKTSPELILAAMKRYARTRVGEPEQFTVHPATWLAAERWADEAKGLNEPDVTPEQIAASKDWADRYFKRGKYKEAGP